MSAVSETQFAGPNALGSWLFPRPDRALPERGAKGLSHDQRFAITIGNRCVQSVASVDLEARFES